MTKKEREQCGMAEGGVGNDEKVELGMSKDMYNILSDYL
jgi:hypothetical protein